MSPAKERSRCVILFEVLKAVREGKKSTKTRIMQRACLDWRGFNRYFTFLVDKGFISSCNPNDKLYEVTPKGTELYLMLKDVVKLCEP